jgi:hypothetical protein
MMLRAWFFGLLYLPFRAALGVAVSVAAPRVPPRGTAALCRLRTVGLGEDGAQGDKARIYQGASAPLGGRGGPYLNTLDGNAETLPTHTPAHPAPRVRGDAVRLPKPSAIPPYRAASGVHAMPTLAWKYQTTRFFLPMAHQLAGQERAKTAHARARRFGMALA